MKALDLIFAARPMLHLPAWSIFLLTDHFLGGHFEINDMLILMAITLILSGAYYINQLYDYEGDLINNKLGFLQRGLITKTQMKAAFIVVSCLGPGIAFAVEPYLGLLTVVLFLMGYIYSAPPFRLKDRPFWGLWANSAAYGLIIPFLVPGFVAHWDEKTLYIPAYFFLAVSAAYLLTIIPDREGDIQSGKVTLAAILPDSYLLLAALLLLYLSLMAAIRMDIMTLALISAVSIVLFLLAAVVRKKNIILFACKVPILLVALLAGIFNPGYLVFLVAVILTTRIYYRQRFGMQYPKLD